MASKTIFAPTSTKAEPSQTADTVNASGLPAYSFADKHALAQLSATGTFNRTYYVKEEDQVKAALDLCDKVSQLPNGLEFISKCAVYSKMVAKRKDYPAFLLAWLSKRSPALFARIFMSIINNGKMLRNLVQIIRSGVTGRKSLGNGPKRMIGKWLNSRRSEQLLRDSVGNDPTLAQIIKLAHPKPINPEREMIFRYLRGHDGVDFAKLPELYRQFEAFKKAPTETAVPDVDFRQLTACGLTDDQWKSIFMKGGWTFLRMNLNNALKRGVFADPTMLAYVAAQLRDREQILKSGVYPYQLFTTFKHTSADMHPTIRSALHDAMEISLENTPFFDCKVLVCLDISGSMISPVTGHRKGATTVTNCNEVAALIAAAIMRRNPDTTVIPFSDRINILNMNELRKQNVLTVTRKFLELPSGGTSCPLPLAHANTSGMNPDLVVYISDNESNIFTNSYGSVSGVLSEFDKLKKRNPKARMVCIDLTPNKTGQAPERDDILNIGGFNDGIFDVIRDFVTASKGADHWIDVIEKIWIPTAENPSPVAETSEVEVLEVLETDEL